MKKINKLFGIVLALLILVTVTACGNNYDEYVGNQYSGKDPWGNEVAVTVKTIENDKMTYTFTDVLGEGDASLTVYGELSGELKDNKVSFTLNGATIEDEKVTFDYAGTITLKDGNVIVNYEKGSLNSASAEGGSSSYNVLALEDANKTVTLTKIVLDK